MAPKAKKPEPKTATKPAAKPAAPVKQKAAPAKSKNVSKGKAGGAKGKAQGKKGLKGVQDKGVQKPGMRKQRFALRKALDCATKVIKGRQGTRIKKIRTSTHFRVRPTLKLPRRPMYPRKSMPRKPRMDNFSIIRYPLTTEAAMKKIEDHNTLVFITDVRANKNQIKTAVTKLYQIDTIKVNTLIRPDGLKKAYVKLASDYDALDVANKIGII